jgi:hypothetical protein
MNMRFIGKLTAATLIAISVLNGGVQAATQAEINAFLANPSSALAANPNGGAALVAFARDMAMSSPDALPVLIALLSSASQAQQTALGSGLGQAAQASLTTNPTYAAQIQQAVAASGNGPAIAGYSGVTGNTNTASVGGGGGGGQPAFGAAGGSGGAGGGSSGSSPPGQNTTSTSSPQ